MLNVIFKSYLIRVYLNRCNSRFTHANRHCTSHPSASLVRSDDFALLDSPGSNQSEEVKQWILR